MPGIEVLPLDHAGIGEDEIESATAAGKDRFEGSRKRAVLVYVRFVEAGIRKLMEAWMPRSSLTSRRCTFQPPRSARALATARPIPLAVDSPC